MMISKDGTDRSPLYQNIFYRFFLNLLDIQYKINSLTSVLQDILVRRCQPSWQKIRKSSCTNFFLNFSTNHNVALQSRFWICKAVMWFVKRGETFSFEFLIKSPPITKISFRTLVKRVEVGLSVQQVEGETVEEIMVQGGAVSHYLINSHDD